jgi:predicted PurR-regulated permease PerM
MKFFITYLIITFIVFFGIAYYNNAQQKDRNKMDVGVAWFASSFWLPVGMAVILYYVGMFFVKMFNKISKNPES